MSTPKPLVEIVPKLHQKRLKLSLVEGARDALESIIAQNSPEEALGVALEYQLSNDWLYVSPHTFDLPSNLFMLTPSQGAVITPSCEVYPYEWVATTATATDQLILEDVLNTGYAFMDILYVKKALTYRRLIIELLSLPLEQLDTDVTVFIDGEYRQIRGRVAIETLNGVLDRGHPYLTDKPNLSQ